jgi:hypothetical protein
MTLNSVPSPASLQFQTQNRSLNVSFLVTHRHFKYYTLNVEIITFSLNLFSCILHLSECNHI